MLKISQSGKLNQALFTIGFVFTTSAIAAYLFGTVNHAVKMPEFLTGFIELAGVKFPPYWIFLAPIALVVTVAVVGGLEYTRFGAMVRAAVENQKLLVDLV